MLLWNEINNNILNTLSTDFASHVDSHTGSACYFLEHIQDKLRHCLASMDNEFAFGEYTSMHTIMD